MSDPKLRIQSLKAEAESSRLRMRHDFQDVQSSLDFTGRIKRNISAHPLKYAAAAAAGGVILIKVLPLVLRLTSRGWTGKLATTLLTRVAPPLAAAVARRFQSNPRP